MHVFIFVQLIVWQFLLLFCKHLFYSVTAVLPNKDEYHSLLERRRHHVPDAR